MKDENIILTKQEAWRLYQLLEELNHVLHDPEGVSNAQWLEDWLKNGTYAEIHHAYYAVACKWFPADEDGEVKGP